MKKMAILVITLLGAFYHSLVMASFTQYSSDEVNFMHRAYLKHKPEITINEVRTRLYENQFLLQQATLKTPAIIKRQSAVGFSTQYHVERYLKNLFDSQLAIKVQSSQVKLDTYDSQWLKHTLGPYPKNGQYMQSLIKKMQQIDLTPILYNSINLYEFIDTLSMQVRFKLHRGDSELFKSELIKKRQFNIALLKAKPILAKQNIDIEHLYEIAKGDILRPSIQSWLGINTMMHMQSPVLEKLEKQVNKSEIKAFYQANKSQFKFLSQVKAHGAQFASRTNAVDFRTLADNKSLKQALVISGKQDIYAQYNSELNRKNKSSWVVQLAFTTKENTISAVIRTPRGEWVVIHSYEHQFDYFSPEDETVRYQATKAIAKQKAAQQYENNWLKWQNKTGVIL
ncbi:MULTISPECIES: peptidyl-prolyl cis-trans isomerase [Pseudoalteromonas]|uniref:peptidylprolyl isomerase n=1 Tax=Pseudoalteromonas TaxID=53246 RepID=UPI000D6F3898|nr:MULTISPECIES: peptidylprolyl isomerase [Pseudoalteromonas]PWS53805.1 peptidyl-prolyl cis-trans isomerase [Pseudoalteromonas sp. meg-B1]